MQNKTKAILGTESAQWKNKLSKYCSVGAISIIKNSTNLPGRTVIGLVKNTN